MAFEDGVSVLGCFFFLLSQQFLLPYLQPQYLGDSVEASLQLLSGKLIQGGSASCRTCPPKVWCSGKGPDGHLTAGEATSPPPLEKSSYLLLLLRALLLICADTAPNMQPSSRTGLLMLSVVHSKGTVFHHRLNTSMLLTWPITACSNYILLKERPLKANLESSLHPTLNNYVYSHVHKPLSSGGPALQCMVGMRRNILQCLQILWKNNIFKCNLFSSAPSLVFAWCLIPVE